MANTLINQDYVDQLITKTLTEDMNQVLEEATQKVLEKLSVKVKEKVAARMIAMAGSDYNLQYCRDELQIRVLIKDELKDR